MGIKIGDRVKIVDERGASAALGRGGETGVVTEYVCDLLTAKMDKDGVKIQMYARRFELIPTVKVGDRVRMTREVDGHKAECGATVIVDDETGYHPLLLKFDERQSWAHTGREQVANGYGYWVSVADIEPMPVAAPAAPLKIEAGKYYRTRDGRKVGPMRDASGSWRHPWKWAAPQISSPVTDAGAWNFTLDPGDNDLVALWQDKPTVGAQVDTLAEEYGPVVPVAPGLTVGARVVRTSGFKPEIYGTVRATTDTPRYYTVEWDDNEGDSNTWQAYELRVVADVAPKTAKFKVGDIVGRADGYMPEQRMRIIEVVNNDNFTVEWLAAGNGSTHRWRAHEFELVTPASTIAIVCLIENGQPKPATPPFVHTSVDGAATEAKRLAGVHKGQQFGVFALTGEVAFVEKTYEHEWQRQAADGRTFAAALTLNRQVGINHDAALSLACDFARAA